MTRNFFFLIFIRLRQVLVATHGLFHRGPGTLVARGLSCSTARGVLVPQPEIETAFPALQGRFLTTEPLGKSHREGFKCDWLEYGYSID